MKGINIVKFGDVTGPEALIVRSNIDVGRPLSFSGRVTQTLIVFLYAGLLGTNYKGNRNGDGHSCRLFAYHQLAKELD
jgi:hypothetical protein